jgi:Tautomerase enzyme
MPHARIDLHRVHQPRLQEFSDAILRGMVRGLDMPEDDLFQIFRLHDPGELVYSPTFPNQRRDDIIFVELVAQVGYTDEQKQAAMSAIADEIEALGITRDDVLCVMIEVHGAAWHAAESRPAA